MWKQFVTVVDASVGKILWTMPFPINPLVAEEGIQYQFEVLQMDLSSAGGLIVFQYASKDREIYVLDLTSKKMRQGPLKTGSRSTEANLVQYDEVDGVLILDYGTKTFTLSIWSGSSYKMKWSSPFPSPCFEIEYGLSWGGYIPIVCDNSPIVGIHTTPGQNPLVFSMDLNSGTFLSNFTFAVPDFKDTSYDINWFGRLSGELFGFTVSSYTPACSCGPRMLFFNAADVSKPLLVVNNKYGGIGCHFASYYDDVAVYKNPQGKTQVWAAAPDGDEFPNAVVYSFLL
jgi:hypothetical protein